MRDPSSSHGIHDVATQDVPPGMCHVTLATKWHTKWLPCAALQAHAPQLLGYNCCQKRVNHLARLSLYEVFDIHVSEAIEIVALLKNLTPLQWLA